MSTSVESSTVTAASTCYSWKREEGVGSAAQRELKASRRKNDSNTEEHDCDARPDPQLNHLPALKAISAVVTTLELGFPGLIDAVPRCRVSLALPEICTRRRATQISLYMRL